MRSPHRLRHALAILAITVLAWPALPTPARAETVIPLARFKSITVRSGAKVVLRHGTPQRVTVLEGDMRCAGITVDDGGRLVIDKYRADCRRYALEIEVVTPAIDEVMVMDGGTIRSLGEFPSQPELGAAVRDGGTIDVRSMPVDVVTAVVKSGGRIFTRPQDVLHANIAHGGIVRYWGSPKVKSSIEHGGVVTKGTAGEEDEPLHDMDAPPPPVPAAPAVPPKRART